EELADDSEGELAFQLRPARTEDAHARGGRAFPRSREQCGLPDPGRPLDDEEPAPAGAGICQRRFDLRQLFAALEQRTGGRDAAHVARAYADPGRKVRGVSTVRTAVRGAEHRVDRARSWARRRRKGVRMKFAHSRELLGAVIAAAALAMPAIASP